MHLIKFTFVPDFKNLKQLHELERVLFISIIRMYNLSKPGATTELKVKPKRSISQSELHKRVCLFFLNRILHSSKFEKLECYKLSLCMSQCIGIF